MLNPTPDQAEAIARISVDDSGGALIGAEIGAGKTLISVEGALERWARRVLITAPIPVFESWRDTLAAQTGGAAVLRPCGKTKYAGIPAKILKENLGAYLAGEVGWYFMGREFWIAQDWYTDHDDLDAKGRPRRKQRRVYEKKPVDVLVMDEAHFASDRGSRGYKTFLRHAADYKMAVTGTFFGDNFQNAWTLPNALWGDHFTDTFALWKTAYAKTEYDHFAYDHKKVIGELEPGNWVSKMPTYIFIKGHAGEVIPESHFVDLYPSQMRMYTEMDKRYASRAESGEWVLADLRVEAIHRLRQVSIADIDYDPETDSITYPLDGNSAKVDELLRMLANHDEQVLISLDYADAADYVRHRLEQKGISAGIWAGKQRVSDDERMALKESFLAGQTRAMIGIPKAMGTGVDGLQKVCRRLYILSEDRSETTRSQLIGRLNRKGQERPVYVTNIHSRGTLDQDITQSLALRAIDNAVIREGR